MLEHRLGRRPAERYVIARSRADETTILIGSLPVSLAAEVCARYLHLSLDLTAALRGRELTAEQMRDYRARVEEYRVTRR